MNKSKNGIYLDVGDTILFEFGDLQYSGGKIKAMKDGVAEITPYGNFNCSEIDVLDCVSKEFIDAISNLCNDDGNDRLFDWLYPANND